MSTATPTPSKPEPTPAGDIASAPQSPERHTTFQPDNYESAERKAFMISVNKFMAESGKPLFKIPIMGYKELDLFQLFREVTAYGGFNEVVKNVGTWSKIWKRLDNFDPSITDSSFRLKKNYERYLLDYEHKCFPENRAPKDGKTGTVVVDVSFNLKAEKKLRKKQAQTNQEVPRNPDSSVKLPFSIGDFTVENLGTIVPRAPFVTEKYVWPVGYTAYRLLPRNGAQNEFIKYTCTVKDVDGKIEFLITCSDGSSPISSHSLSSAWRILHKRLPKADRSVSIFGADRFGLTHPNVVQLFSSMEKGEEAFALQKKLMEGGNKKRKYCSGSSSEGEGPSTTSQPAAKVVKKEKVDFPPAVVVTLSTSTQPPAQQQPRFGSVQSDLDDLESAVLTLSSLKYCSVY